MKKRSIYARWRNYDLYPTKESTVRKMIGDIKLGEVVTTLTPGYRFVSSDLVTAEEAKAN